jgi:DNA-binding NtrC family response regulator
MLSSVLLLEPSSTSAQPELRRIVESHARCELRSWQSFARESLHRAHLHLIMASVEPQSADAADFFQWLLKNPVPIPVLAVLPESIDPEILRTVAEVTDDFLFSPVREKELNARIARILAPRSSAEILGAEIGLANLVGKDPSFVKALEQVKLFTSSNAPVLITGETGTGKELFAHAIHSLSRRKNGPFIPLDCSALPEQLTESELFGHCRGAFTDARNDRKGLAAMAEGGTLFLDEIDSLSLCSQAKLLRFLQEGTYRAVGADRFVRANVRVIAASNLNLEECVRERRFRADLYFRVNVLRLHLPSLRERRGDIVLLAKYFLDRQAVETNGPSKAFSPGALCRLQSYSWPGNVRELFNTVERAAVSCCGRRIMPAYISFGGFSIDSAKKDFVGCFRQAKQCVIEQFEQDYIEGLMAKHQGNITHAAQEAGKERRAFGKLVKKYRIMHSRSA